MKTNLTSITSSTLRTIGMATFIFSGIGFMASSAAASSMPRREIAPRPSNNGTTKTEIRTTTSRSPGGALNLGPVLPAGDKAWGQKIQISIYATQNGKPAAKVYIKSWFSGQKGIKSSSFAGTTDKSGRWTTTVSLPNWKNSSKWVDLNGSCDKIAAFGMWRVK